MKDFLRKIPFFADLPEEDLDRLCECIEIVKLDAGEILFPEGSQGDRAYVIRKGEIQILKASSGREVLLAVRGPGEVIGEMALIESRPRMATVRARTSASLLAIPKEHFDHLVNTSISAANALFRTFLERWKNTEAMLRESEKLAQLGIMTAGVAHELNNPTAAVQRSAVQMVEAANELFAAQQRLNELDFTGERKDILAELTDRARQTAGQPPELDALARDDRQMEVEDWLTARGFEDAWSLSSPLVDLHYRPEGLETLYQTFEPHQFGPVLRWLCATQNFYTLLYELGQAAGRISAIAKALKSYTYLDQAPMQRVNLHAGLDDSLLILRHKLRNFQVRREYDPELPEIEAYGSELNQVWTNLLDNAADALESMGASHSGTIIIRTGREEGGVFVDVEDNGPGIPPEVQPKIFVPFFTTKPPGKGTGLGLDISYNIIVHKHRGSLEVDSEPGRTRFHIWLPLDFARN